MNGSAPARVERGSNFYLGFLVLSKEKRGALSTVYAFCREVDDIVDAPGADAASAGPKLEAWRGEIERVYAGGAREPIAKELEALRPRFNFPKEAFLGVIAGVETDLRKNRFESYAELEAYMDGVASCVGYLCIEIFGYHGSGARDYARYLGHAFQLTNILRDVGADRDKGRVYLPAEDLRRFGLDADRLDGPGFEALMAFELARARGLYRRARQALANEDRVAMRPAEIMAGVYEALLEKIAAEPRGALKGRVELGRLRKIAAALRGFCGGGFDA